MNTMLLILVLVIAGCSQWDGPAVIHRHGGQPSLSCPGGLQMTSDSITCYDKSGMVISVPWKLVRGYEAR